MLLTAANTQNPHSSEMTGFYPTPSKSTPTGTGSISTGCAHQRQDCPKTDIHQEGGPFCLCELRFHTGDQCFPHFVKGANGKTVETPGNQHWAWSIDVAPRGYVCPLVYARFAKYGDAISDGLEGCNILITNPTEDWALEQKPEDAVGTVAGRVKDIVYGNNICNQCDNDTVASDRRLLQSQKWKFQYHNEMTTPISPWQYKPRTGRSNHELLKPDEYYHEHDL
ncbi:hypothetical protein EK21DRAFT_89534 [Setomelanomma holmii]|uniref:Uncharacterized protein n=1 Tax=Setomelanomma holmii TaxID=210430 RepID=A0A9P4H7W4_9PLEO|nr:hypothetical protein EK21DRAFT_89534 [Setomelanomma holmii]